MANGDLGLRLIRVNSQLANAVLETFRTDHGRTQDELWARVYEACREVTQAQEALYDWNTRGRFEQPNAAVVGGLTEPERPDDAGVAALARVLCPADVICTAHVRDARTAVAWMAAREVPRA